MRRLCYLLLALSLLLGVSQAVLASEELPEFCGEVESLLLGSIKSGAAFYFQAAEKTWVLPYNTEFPLEIPGSMRGDWEESISVPVRGGGSLIFFIVEGKIFVDIDPSELILAEDYLKPYC